MGFLGREGRTLRVDTREEIPACRTESEVGAASFFASTASFRSCATTTKHF